MKLSEAREIFKRIKKTCEIEVKKHPKDDHPDRKFTDDEIIDLVRNASSMMNPVLPSAPAGSFLLKVKDDKRRDCELGIFIRGTSPGEYVIVIHAYRKMR